VGEKCGECGDFLGCTADFPRLPLRRLIAYP
jgi:hypothetical protein